MTTAAELRAVDLLVEDIFRLRCEARAILVAACAMDFIEAVDGLQADALASGLVFEIGQDAVQQIMAEAFHDRH
jgi:hypothetical protein